MDTEDKTDDQSEIKNWIMALMKGGGKGKGYMGYKGKGKGNPPTCYN